MGSKSGLGASVIQWTMQATAKVSDDHDNFSMRVAVVVATSTLLLAGITVGGVNHKRSYCLMRESSV